MAPRISDWDLCMMTMLDLLTPWMWRRLCPQQNLFGLSQNTADSLALGVLGLYPRIDPSQSDGHFTAAAVLGFSPTSSISASHCH